MIEYLRQYTRRSQRQRLKDRISKKKDDFSTIDRPCHICQRLDNDHQECRGMSRNVIECHWKFSRTKSNVVNNDINDRMKYEKADLVNYCKMIEFVRDMSTEFDAHGAEFANIRSVFVYKVFWNWYESQFAKFRKVQKLLKRKSDEEQDELDRHSTCI
jgi:hypothetical protein